MKSVGPTIFFFISAYTPFFEFSGELSLMIDWLLSFDFEIALLRSFWSFFSFEPAVIYVITIDST